jgi:hypothetical protein
MEKLSFRVSQQQYIYIKGIVIIFLYLCFKKEK